MGQDDNHGKLESILAVHSLVSLPTDTGSINEPWPDLGPGPEHMVLSHGAGPALALLP